MEGFFAACGLPDILERSPRGERPHGSETSPLPDGGPGQTLPKVRHGIRLPCRSIPETEHHGPHVRQDGLPLPPARNSHETGRLPGSSRASSRVVRVPAPPTLPSLPVSPKRPSSARIASRPWRAMPPALSKRMPDGIRLFIAGRPLPILSELFQRPEASTGEKERKKTLRPPSLPSIPPPPLQPYVMPYFKQPPDSDGDFRPDLKKVFSGMGRAREGKGQFLQKTSLPLSSPYSTAPTTPIP